MDDTGCAKRDDGRGRVSGLVPVLDPRSGLEVLRIVPSDYRVRVDRHQGKGNLFLFRSTEHAYRKSAQFAAGGGLADCSVSIVGCRMSFLTRRDLGRNFLAPNVIA